MSEALRPEDRPRLAQLFERAVDLPEAERAAFVAAECGSNEALRAELERLLAALAGEDHLGALQTAAPSRAGTRIGAYELLERIGEGGMGEVYLAAQREPVARRVALKIIKPGMDSGQVVARFEAERQALARMTHPNVARVYDGGTTGSGSPYFVMEYIPGEPITEYCDRRGLPTRARLELFLGVCEGVQHAHQKGIVHRDLKPSNLLVLEEDGRAVPKVIDFGVARATTGRLVERTLNTIVGQVVGTLDYMSPEQADPSSVEVDTRSDVYSLGVVLYQLLSGLLPFDHDAAGDRPLSEIQRAIREKDPPTPSARLRQTGTATSLASLRGTDERSLVRQLSGDLDWICLRALEKDPARRYATVNGLAMDVRRHLAGEPVDAAPPSVGYRLGKFVRRNKTAVTAGTLVILALVLGVVGTTYGMLEAQAQRVRTATEADRAQVVVEMAKEMLSAADPQRAKGTDYTVRQMLDDFAQGLGDRLAGQPEVGATLHAIMAEAYAGLLLYAEAEEHAQAALRLRKSALGEEDLRVVDDLEALGNIYFSQGKFPQARECVRGMVAIREKQPVPDAEAIASNRWILAAVLRRGGWPGEADTEQREALDVMRRALGDAYPVVPPAPDLADIPDEYRDLARLEATNREWLAVQRIQHGDESIEVAYCLLEVAGLVWGQKRLPEAEKLFGESLELHRSLLPGHPRVGITANQLGQVLDQEGKLAQAEVAHREAFEVYRTATGIEGPWTVASFFEVTNMLIKQREFAKAESWCQTWLPELRQHFGEGSPQVATALRLLDTALREQGKPAAAATAAEADK